MIPRIIIPNDILPAVVDPEESAADCAAGDAGGGIAMAYNSLGMYRGAANANGVFQVSIWEEPELRD